MQILPKIAVAVGVVLAPICWYLEQSLDNPKSFANFILASKARIIWMVVFILTLIVFVATLFVFANAVSTILLKEEITFSELMKQKISLPELVKMAY